MRGLLKQRKHQIAAAALAALALAGFAGWSYSSPWRALDRLEKAAARGDGAELAELVDFEAVRVNLARDLTDKTVQTLGLNPYSESAQTAFQTYLTLAGSIVTPQAMSKVSEELKKGAGAPGAGAKGGAGWSWEGRYASLGRFEVALRPPGAPANEPAKIRIELARQGPMSWRANRLALPEGKLALPSAALSAPGPMSPVEPPVSP